MSDRIADVLVVGGGPAGLAAALWLGRHQLRTVVVDRGKPRNRFVNMAFGYLGFDSQPPDAVLHAGREELNRYPTVTVEPGKVERIHREDDGFVAELANEQRLRANAVVLTTGVEDEVPPLPDLDRHYGKSVFVCPLCDGHELLAKHVIVLGAGGRACAYADEVLQWASSVTIVPLADEVPEDEPRERIAISAARAEAVHGNGKLEGVRLADGTIVEAEAIFLRADVHPRTEIAAHLGCELEGDGRITIDADGRTSVEGVYAAGDCTPGPQIVQVAAAEGVRAGLACAQDLLAKKGSFGDASAQRPIT